MPRAIFFLLCLFAVAGTARAQNLDVMTKGMSLGKIIGSEQYCGLTYDQKSIEAWIEQNIPADAMQFSQFLDAGIGGETYEQAGRSDSAKTAHCAAVKRTAAHYEFISG